jgi:PAS domain S-box-containing protein
MAPDKPALPDTVYEQLQQAFADFQVRSETLSRAYAAMQDDFKKLNIELDTKNKQLEESLARQEEMQTYLNSIVESMNSGLVSVDVSGKITRFNHAASVMTGYKPASVIGKHYGKVFTDGTASEHSILGVLQSGKGHDRDEKVIWHKRGSPVPVSFQSAVLKDQKGRRLGAVEIFSDISRIKTLEQEMQQNKTMAALGGMAATVAHEIRNPLGAMGVWAGLLDRDLDKDDPRRETLRKIIDALSRLNRIVSNLLLYSRPVRAQFRELILQDILAETVNYIDLEVERLHQKIEIRRDWNERAPLRVEADPEKLQQIIMNLCLNSVQAMPQGGLLTISCTDSKKKDMVVFSVTDTGVGIEKERLEKIFDPFHTTKENGTGLGLAIVSKFVEYHSGYLHVKSKVQEGTTIRVFLPKLNK